MFAIFINTTNIIVYIFFYKFNHLIQLYTMFGINRVSDVYNSLFVNPTCYMGCDTTLCHLLVLSKTGTCFSQSGTFSSRRHPINLGINSPCLCCHGDADRTAIALSFPFCPSERKPPCCMLPGRPPRIGTVALARIYADLSICTSSTDNKTWPTDMRHSVSAAEKGHARGLDAVVLQ